MDSSEALATTEALHNFDAMMRDQAPGFAESKARSLWTRDQIIERLIAGTGSSREELVAWFLWQDGVVFQPGVARPGLFLMLRPVGLLEAMSYLRLAPPGEEVPSEGPNRWVAIADDDDHTIICDVISGEIYSIYVAAGETKHLAASLIELIATWSELWRVAIGWDDEKKDFITLSSQSTRLDELIAKSGY